MERYYPSQSLLLPCIFIVVLLIQFPTVNGQHTLIQKLKIIYPDFSPNIIVDIGANKAAYATVVRNLYPDSYILLFEASDQHNATLEEFVRNDALTSSNGNTTRSEYHIGILSSVNDEVVEFYDGPADTGNSIFRENTRHFVDVTPMQKRTKTLDSALAQSPLIASLQEKEKNYYKKQQQQKQELGTSINGSVSIDIIKADVQGSELVVLQGAHKALQQATFVQLEGGTVEFNVGGACFYQMDAFLRSYGYFLHDINDFLSNDAFKTKGLGQFDVMYVRPSSPKLPLYLKENNTTFCGAERHPLDLPGVYDARKSRPVALSKLSKSTFPIPSYSDIIFTSDWYNGFFNGILLTILVLCCIVVALNRTTISKRLRIQWRILLRTDKE